MFSMVSFTMKGRLYYGNTDQELIVIILTLHTTINYDIHVVVLQFV
jgi:hypothetical protein